MTHRYALAAVMLAAFALPAAAQSTTQTDTSKKSSTGTTMGTANGAVSDTAHATSTVNPNGTPSNGAVVSPTPQPSAGPATNPPKEATESATQAPATTGNSSYTATPATGIAAPHEAAHVNVKVAQSVASSVKVSGDSAFAIARSVPDAGEVSSADLEMNHGRLVYQVKMLLKNKGASEVIVDAMTGEILKDKKYGGLKAVAEHHDENKKLLDAKRDSSATKPQR